MKILLAHNHYGSGAPSGENRVFALERSMLEGHGHTVHVFERHSDELRARGMLGLAQGALATPWNPFEARRMAQTVAELQPDVMHAHNTFPLISPAVFSAARATTRVLTLHNYRMFCPAGIPMRDGKVCTECIDRRSVSPALKYGCYRGSRIATLPLAANVALHRWLGTWSRHVDAFIAMSETQREHLAQAGLPPEKIHVKPNFLPGKPVVGAWDLRKKCVVYVGRISEEKGLRSLIKAWALWGAAAPRLQLVGDGPLRRELEIEAEGLNVEFSGQLPPAAAQDEIARAQLLVLPSECFETFGMVLAEAFGVATPVAVSNLGALPSIVQHGGNGVVFEAFNPQALLSSVRTAWETPGELQRLSAGARMAFEALYNEDANYQMLMQIYEQAVTRNKRAAA